MEWQHVIDLVGGAVIAVIGWFSRQLWDAVAELRRDVHSIEISLPMYYVRRDEFSENVKEIKSMLEKIFDKLDGKADK
jgi:hypothetical protein